MKDFSSERDRITTLFTVESKWRMNSDRSIYNNMDYLDDIELTPEEEYDSIEEMLLADAQADVEDLIYYSIDRTELRSLELYRGLCIDPFSAWLAFQQKVVYPMFRRAYWGRELLD